MVWCVSPIVSETSSQIDCCQIGITLLLAAAITCCDVSEGIERGEKVMDRKGDPDGENEIIRRVFTLLWNKP